MSATRPALKWADFQGRLESLGPDFRRFLKSEAGHALIACMVEKHRDLAVEALDNAQEGVSQDFYKGQRAALGWLTAQMASMALLEPTAPDEFSGAPGYVGGFSGGGVA